MAIRFETESLVYTISANGKACLAQLRELNQSAREQIEKIFDLILRWLNDAHAIAQCSRRAAERVISGTRGDYAHHTESDTLTVFIHGFLHNETAFEKHDGLYLQKCSFLRVNISDTRQGIDQSAREIFEKIENFAKNRSPLKVNIVGHSMGGIIASTITENLSSEHFEVKNVIAIASPFKGTNLALPIFAPIFGKSIEQMGRDSEFLTDLVQKMQQNERVKYHFIGSTKDQVIDPWTSCFPFGEEHSFQEKVEGIGHNALLSDQRIEKWVFDRLMDRDV